MRYAHLAMFLSAAAACRTTPAVQAPADEAVEVVAVERALNDWYTAIASYDSAGIAGAMTPTFFILEDTLPLDKLQLTQRILEARTQGSQSARLTELRTRVHGDVAWTTLRNHEIFSPTTGAPDSVAFLETVVLLKVNGRWLIDRYHAAKLPPAPSRPGTP